MTYTTDTYADGTTFAYPSIIYSQSNTRATLTSVTATRVTIYNAAIGTDTRPVAAGGSFEIDLYPYAMVALQGATEDRNAMGAILEQPTLPLLAPYRNHYRGTAEIYVNVYAGDTSVAGVRYLIPVVDGYLLADDSYSARRWLRYYPSAPMTIDIDYIGNVSTAQSSTPAINVIQRGEVIGESYGIAAKDFGYTHYRMSDIIPSGALVGDIYDVEALHNRTGSSPTNGSTHKVAVEVCCTPTEAHIYLRWVDHLGRVCYGMFLVSAKKFASKVSEKQVAASDLKGETVDAEQFYRGRNVLTETTPSESVTFGLDAQSIKRHYSEMRELLSSPVVDMWLGEAKWQRVTVGNGSIEIDERRDTFDFEATAVIPTFTTIQQ